MQRTSFVKTTYQEGDPIADTRGIPDEQLDVCPQCGGAFWNPRGRLLVCSECSERLRDYRDEQREAWTVGAFF